MIRQCKQKKIDLILTKSIQRFARNTLDCINSVSYTHLLCTIDSGADHADLTDEYAAMPIEMKKVAKFFGKEVLREVDEKEFYEKIADVRKETGDRAVLRGIHFFNENRRVQLQVRALKNDNFDAFLHYVNESGLASWTLLQNVLPLGAVQPVSYTHLSGSASSCDP